MYCQSCGAEMENGAKFCPACGHEVGAPTQTSTSAQPASPAAAAPAPKKKGGVLKIVLGVIGGFVALIVLIIMLALWATSGLLDPVQRHFDALKAGDMIAAYAETSSAFRQQTSPQQYADFVASYPIMTNYTDLSFGARSFENDDGKLEATLTGPDGVAVPMEVLLIKENGNWKILGLTLRNQATGNNPPQDGRDAGK